MGYCISKNKSKFAIRAGDVPSAFKALQDLGVGQNDDRAHGASFEHGRQTARWFSWMNGCDPSSWKSISDAMSDWRYPVTLDETGSVVSIDFDGEKIGDENVMFAAIAPFVAKGSFLELQGEDGALWRWVFDGKAMREVQAKISWEK